MGLLSPLGDRSTMDINKLSSKIIGASIELYKDFGPGQIESAYEERPSLVRQMFFLFSALSAENKNKVTSANSAPLR